ncbi:MAG: hypothetical protein CVV24_06795 [Ignavibacteriae bacterium HGW-Ignavibacteriae-3]|nr:MAG: hypothetical protein CVV24_06795 [Ignavibacteriae bacterium HGW-Ignavibacteriae-3]
MKNIKMLISLIILSTCINALAQTYNELIKLNKSSVDVFYSAGHYDRAISVANRCESAIEYVNNLIDFRPKISILVLNPEDWKKHATFPVYGMPHYLDSKTLVVASEDNDFWKSFIPPLDKLPSDLADKIRKAYSKTDGTLSMMAFFDLLAIHELGHGFHEQGGLIMNRLWMQELFCNIMLHTYIAENEPKNILSLEVFPEMVVSAGTAGYKFTSLADFEKLYDNMDPKNYGWYQCRLHVASKKIYEAGGSSILVKLWKSLKENKKILSDEEFASFLNNEVHKEVAKIQTEW